MQRSHWYTPQAVCFEVSIVETLESPQNKRWSACRADPTRTSVGRHLLYLGQSERQRPGGPSCESVRPKRLLIWDRAAKFVLRNLCVFCISFTFEKHFLCFETRISNIHRADVNIAFSIETFLAIASEDWHQKYTQIFAPFSMIVDDSVLTKIFLGIGVTCSPWNLIKFQIFIFCSPWNLIKLLNFKFLFW